MLEKKNLSRMLLESQIFFLFVSWPLPGTKFPNRQENYRFLLTRVSIPKFKKLTRFTLNPFPLPSLN